MIFSPSGRCWSLSCSKVNWGNLGSLPLAGELHVLPAIQARDMPAITHPTAVSIWRMGFLLLFDLFYEASNRRAARWIGRIIERFFAAETPPSDALAFASL